MTTSIGSLGTGGYYSLSNPSAGTNTSAPSNLTSTLVQALSAADNSSSGSSDNSAFLLDLSPQAQQLMNGTSGTSSLASILNGTGSSSPSLSNLFGGGTGSFSLTDKQKQDISAILAKYKDAPYTQDTFNQIQNDLNAAGLGPSLLSMQDQAKSFNPAVVLLDALNGDSTSSGGFGVSAADEQSKQSNYMQSIIQQWQNISTDPNAQAQNGLAPAASSGGA